MQLLFLNADGSLKIESQTYTDTPPLQIRSWRPRSLVGGSYHDPWDIVPTETVIHQFIAKTPLFWIYEER